VSVVLRKPKAVEEGWAWVVHCAQFNAFKVHTQMQKKKGKMTYGKLLLKVTKQWADDQPPLAVTTDEDENNIHSSQAGSTWQTIWGHEEIQCDKDCGNSAARTPKSKT
jgi:hypothetical protein